MKRCIYTTAFSLAFLATIPIAQAHANPVETSGGAVRTHLEAQSKSKNPSSPKVQVPAKSPSSEAVNQDRDQPEKTGSVVKPSSTLDSAYPSYCEPLPSWVKPGDFEYNEVLYKCKYGT